MDEQIKYERYVLDYFKDVGIELSESTHIFYTPKETFPGRLFAALAVKTGDIYKQVGLTLGPKYCFVGDYDMGYYVDSWIYLRHFLPNNYGWRDIGDYFCILLGLKELTGFTYTVTKFGKYE